MKRLLAVLILGAALLPGVAQADSCSYYRYGASGYTDFSCSGSGGYGSGSYYTYPSTGPYRDYSGSYNGQQFSGDTFSYGNSGYYDYTIRSGGGRYTGTCYRYPGTDYVSCS